MDTRNKILTLEAALRLPAGSLSLVTGAFDLLTAAHARDVAAFRARVSGPVLAVVLAGDSGLLPQRARAELVAGLRAVDYVVAASREDVERLLATLRPAAVERLEEADARRAEELAELVRRRQESC